MSIIQKSISPRAWAELFLLALIWGGVFLATRIALDEIGPFTAMAHRCFWAALLLWGVVLLRGQRPHFSARDWGNFLIMGLLNNVIPFSLMAWGQLHIESGLTAILNATTAVFGVLVAACFFADEGLSPRRLFGIGLGFCGVAITMGPDALRGFDLRSMGQIAVLLGTFSYALAGSWARRRLSGHSPYMSALGMLTCSSLVLIALACWFEGAPEMALTLRSWGAIGFYAIVATAGAYLLYYRVLDMAGAGNLMLVTLLIPPVAILLGAVVLGEKLPSTTFVGFGVLALGLVVLDGRLFKLRRNRV